MIKKSFTVLSVATAFFMAQAQDVSTIKNSLSVYSDTSLPGTAKYNAMAGSIGALGGDVSSMSVNPAGLGVAIANDISGTLGIQSYNNNTMMNGNSLDYSNTKTDLTQIGGIGVFNIMGASKWKFVNIGINYTNQTLDNYSETPLISNVIVSGSDTSNNSYSWNVRRHAYDRAGYQSKMSLGLGANYDNRIYFGAGLNFHFANFDQYDTASLTDGSTTASFYKQYTPFSEQSNGFSANVGVIGRVSNMFRLGLALETPVWWNIARVYNSYDQSYSEDRKFSSPFKATASAAFVPSKNFALNVDYTLGLTNPHYKVYGPAESELNSFFDAKAKNVSEVKIGGEYRYQGLRLRAGYGFTSNPIGSSTFSSYTSSGTIADSAYNDLMLSKRNTIGAGIGYDFKSFYMDFAYQNISTKYHDPFLFGTTSSAGSGNGYIYDVYATNSSAYAVSEVKNHQNRYFITLGWRF